MSEASLKTASPELRITVAVGAALVVQSALALLWAGGAANRLGQLERRVDGYDIVLERTARLEEQVEGVRRSLTRIEAKLDRFDREGGQ